MNHRQKILLFTIIGWVIAGIIGIFYRLAAYIIVGVTVTPYILAFIEMLIIRKYDDFSLVNIEKNWEIKKPFYTPANFLQYNLSFVKNTLQISIKKSSFPTYKKMPYYQKWEGLELHAKKQGVNFLKFRVKINYTLTDAPYGNIYIRGDGRGKRFLYLFGIDKNGQDIFFHVRDEAEGGKDNYIKEGGRYHLKDLYKKNKWITLGIEFRYNGIFFLIFDFNDKEFNEYKFQPAFKLKELRKEITKDAIKSYYLGLSNFCIKSDIRVGDSDDFKSIVSNIDFIKTRTAPFYWIILIKNKVIYIYSKIVIIVL